MSAVESIPKEKIESLGIDFVESLSSFQLSADFIKEIPISFARRYGMLGLEDDQKNLIIALSDLAHREQLQIISRALNRPFKPLLASANIITNAINDAYQQRTGVAQSMIDNLDRNQVLDPPAESEWPEQSPQLRGSLDDVLRSREPLPEFGPHTRHCVGSGST